MRWQLGQRITSALRWIWLKSWGGTRMRQPWQIPPRTSTTARPPRRYLPGLPHARPTPALQPDPAQRRGDPLPELPAHALLARRGRRGERLNADPRPLSRVGTGGERVASVDRAQAVPRPAKPARQTLMPWAATMRRAADASPHSDALTLRQVCRAGFCRPRHAVGLVNRAARSLSPPTRDRVSGRRPPPEEVCKPDSVLPPRKREQQPFVWSPGCPGDRATDPRERTGSPRLASRPDLPPTRSCSGWGLPSVRSLERTW